ncbi:glycosyltransferase involved in cell wall biosynthesis [Microbacterium foliorum]|uniref:Glycosyltransferase involved in cell wall biosynthesis n=2 Tax=Microbacterium foliorum TaxID=104336 RepID=A0ABU1HR13_9MICO|nr:glycosyltransferase involved in cell wall biosynthesis [Microbacterium foliorum]
MSMKASVIIPTYDRANILAYTLHSLARQTIKNDDFEVIVSDDGSSDRTVDVVREYEAHLNLRYTYHDDLGHRTASTRNAGATLATGETLIFLDSGTLACAEFVESHVREHQDGTTPRAVVGRVGGYDTAASAPPVSLQTRLSGSESLTVAQARAMGLADMRDGELARFEGDIEAALLPWRLFWTGNCSVRTTAFREVGGFDDRFVGWGVEDVDLGYRLSRDGVLLAWSEDALAVEYPHPRATMTNTENNYRNHRLFLESHIDPEIELFLSARRVGKDVHDAAVEYREWIAGMGIEGSALEPQEISSFVGRHAVFGPERSNDLDVLVTPMFDGTGPWRRSVGLDTRLPSGIFESVHISGVYQPIWRRWREQLLAEAGRLAARVTLAPDLGA